VIQHVLKPSCGESAGAAKVSFLDGRSGQVRTSFPSLDKTGPGDLTGIRVLALSLDSSCLVAWRTNTDGVGSSDVCGADRGETGAFCTEIPLSMLSSDTREAHQTYLGTRTFGSLDGVRGLCILAVIWHHAAPDLPGLFFTRGFLAVDMFFVLSGFLIVTLLLRERDRTGAISLRKFYARRTLRIFPIYYLILFGILFLYLVMKPGSTTARSYFAAFPFLLTYTSNWVQIPTANFGITWSLATEEQFYLGWPLVEKLLKPLGVALVLALVIFVNELINYGVLDHWLTAIYGENFELPILDATFTPIALGVLLAHLLHGPKGFGRLFPLLGRPWSFLIFGGMALALIVLWPADISGSGRLLIQLSMMLFLGSIVIREDHGARPVLTFRPLAYMGVISYGIYVYHMWAIHPLRIGFAKLGWNPASFTFFFSAILASMLVAGLSYRFIEKPLLKLKTRFASDAKGRKTIVEDSAGTAPRLALAERTTA
jgi:peptidoglycan/LPS O-acetylase OafA/YrhL